MWRKLAIFVLSLPLLAAAIIWIPLGTAFAVVSSPLFLMMSVIALLKGEDPMWGLVLEQPLLMLSMYADVTGLIPDPIR